MISTSSVNENSAAAAFAVNLPVSQPGNMDLLAAVSGRQRAKVDAVYYNNLIALNGAVSHSGDEVTGQASALLSNGINHWLGLLIHHVLFKDQFGFYIPLGI